MTHRPAKTTDLSALSELAPELASTMASIAGDIALVIDDSGVIRNVAVGADPLTPSAGEWVGRPWAETVTGETRLKIEQLLSEVQRSGVSQRREVNHPGAAGQDIPVAYSAIRLGEHGPVLAVGRDLRAIAAIQQRFVESQRDMERDYWKRRQADARYRQLFQVATDAVLVVDALTLTIVEANRAAAALFAQPANQLVGQPAHVGMERHSAAAIDELLVTTRSTGRPAEIRVRLAGSAAAVDVSAAPFRSDNALLLLVRARAVELHPASPDTHQRLADFVERTPDAVVVTDSSGRVSMANPAFIALCRQASESQVVGRSLGDWLVGAGRDLAAVLSEVRRLGIAPQWSASFQDGAGAAIDVELSVALLTEGDQECLGFTIRRTEARVAGLSLGDELAAALEQVARQVGRVDLHELMREAAHLAERHLIKTALERSAGDRMVAAELLGVSTDSLGMRLARLGLGFGESPGSDIPPALLN